MGKIEIPLHIAELGDNGIHFSINANYNGEEKMLIVDSAASKTVFDLSQLPDSAKVEYEEEINAMGIGGEMMESAMVKLENIELGDYLLEELTSFALPLDSINETYIKHINREIFGLLGADFLLSRKAVLDFGALTLTIDEEES